VGLQAAEALLGLQHCGYSPSQSHPCIAPTFDIAADLPQHGHQTLDRVGAAERAPQFVRRAQADHGEHLVKAETRIEPVDEVAPLVHLAALDQRKAKVSRTARLSALAPSTMNKWAMSGCSPRSTKSASS
jgi:hypothetical protein